MERTGRQAAGDIARDDPRADGAAVRDAAAILARAAEDEAAADQARERYRAQRMPALESDASIAPLLAPGEHVLAIRRSVMVDRRQSRPGPGALFGVAGDLYLTERRLVLVGRVPVSIDLNGIEEVGVSGERLLLVMRDGTGVSLDVGQPRLLRVEIGTARASARS